VSRVAGRSEAGIPAARDRPSVRCDEEGLPFHAPGRAVHRVNADQPQLPSPSSTSLRCPAARQGSAEPRRRQGCLERPHLPGRDAPGKVSGFRVQPGRTHSARAPQRMTAHRFMLRSLPVSRPFRSCEVVRPSPKRSRRRLLTRCAESSGLRRWRLLVAIQLPERSSRCG